MPITSHDVKRKSAGKHNVLVLSTLPVLLGVTQDNGKKKPSIIKFYDFTKGGMDIVDQKIGSYIVKPSLKSGQQLLLLIFSMLPE